ncbi:MAG TPA: BamA/TamA family outer membrane protein [Abditibacteriaceae bacterium]
MKSLTHNKLDVTATLTAPRDIIQKPVYFSSSRTRTAPFFFSAGLGTCLLYSGAVAAPSATETTSAPKPGTVITTTGELVSVRSLDLPKSLRVGARFSGTNQSTSILRPRLVQNIPNNPPAAPRENPQGLEVPVGPESDKPQPGPAPLPAEPAAPATPPTVTTPPLVTPPAGAPALDPSSDVSNANAEGRQIADVRVVGNRVVPAESILLQATTQRGAAYSSRQIDLDRAKIDALGFFASVQHQVTPNLEDPARVDVTFIVIENRVVAGFRFEGAQQLTPAELGKVVTSKAGNVLNRNTVNADIESIQRLYRDRGFAGLVSESRQLEDGTLVFVIQEGKISRVDITGLKKTRENLVRRQIRTKAGDAFDQTKIRQDLNRIYDMGFFEDVSYKISDDADQPGSIIVTVVTKEKRTGTLSLGVGFDNRSKISGFFTVADTNFQGSGRRLSAGAELGSRRTFEVGVGDPFVGKNNASYDISIFNRIVFREPRAVAIVAGNPVDTTLSFEEKRTGIRLNFTKPLDLNREKSILFGGRSESAKLFQVDVDGTNPVPINLPANASGRVTALSAGFLRDRRDLRLDPSKGGREQLIVEKGFSILGGTSSFTKVDLDVRRYIPLMKAQKADELPRLVLAGRFVMGRSFGQLPAFEQYFVGGSDTVRGYDVDEQFGDNQLFSNLELRFRLQRKFQVVGFVDVGKADGGQFASTTSGTLFSVGAGIRVQTPIGPIRLDVGRGRDGIRTHFAIGPTF